MFAIFSAIYILKSGFSSLSVIASSSSCFIMFQRKYVDGNAPPLFMAPEFGAMSCGTKRSFSRGVSRGTSRLASRASVLGPATLQTVQKVLEWKQDDIAQWAQDFKLELVSLLLNLIKAHCCVHLLKIMLVSCLFVSKLLFCLLVCLFICLFGISSSCC